MSGIITRSVLKRINEDLDYFSKEQLRTYINQMQGQVENIARNRDRARDEANYWLKLLSEKNIKIMKFNKSNIFKRIYIAIRKDIC